MAAIVNVMSLKVM